MMTDEPCPVDVIRYYGAGHLTMGTYPSLDAAFRACDEIVWFAITDGKLPKPTITYRSQDGRTVIQPVKV